MFTIVIINNCQIGQIKLKAGEHYTARMIKTACYTILKDGKWYDISADWASFLG